MARVSIASKPTRLRRLLELLVQPTLSPIERAEFVALGSQKIRGVSPRQERAY